MSEGQQATIVALADELGMNVGCYEELLNKALARSGTKAEAESAKPAKDSVIDDIIDSLAASIKLLALQNTRLTCEILNKLSN